MKKQLLLVAALLFTASAYSQISTNHDTRVRTATRTGIESDRPNISTVAADGMYQRVEIIPFTDTIK
uniref:hypothetical protein n=1 Tax=Daejeonella sp. TaxID=2805397 RepID=UPI00404B3570